MPRQRRKPAVAHTVLRASHGRILLGDTFKVLPKKFKPGTVDLIVTSPPFGLVRKKDYGNVDADEYVDWFRPAHTSHPSRFVRRQG